MTTFQTVSLNSNAVVSSMTLSRCDTCCALVQPNDQWLHEKWHGQVGNQGPPGPMGNSGRDVTDEQLEDLERRILRKMLGAQDE